MRIHFWPVLLSFGLSLAACTADDDDAPEFNALPMLTAELTDLDPLDNGTTFSITVSDEDGDLCALDVQYSFDNGKTYAAATILQSTANLHEIPCPPAGEQTTLVWDLEGDRGQQNPGKAILKLQPSDDEQDGPPRHLPFNLSRPGVEISGDCITRPGARNAQWDYLRLAMAHAVVYTETATMSGEAIYGGEEDGFANDGGIVWSFVLPTPPPEEHFQVVDFGNGETGSGAFYIPVAWDDVTGGNEDGIYNPGVDELMGVAAQRFVVFLRPDSPWIVEGWHGVQLELFADPGTMLVSIEDAIDLNMKGYEVDGEQLTLEAEPPSISSPGLRCGALPFQEENVVAPGTVELTSMEYTENTTLIDLEIEATDIPASHWVNEPYGAFAELYAAEMLYLYRDDNGNQSATANEPLAGLAIETDTQMPLSLTYMDAEWRWQDIWLWSVDECWRGFNLVTIWDLGGGEMGWECHALTEPLNIEFVTSIPEETS